jgi:hypothetical protein
MWADFAFFLKWWKNDATSDMREDIKNLVKRGVISLEHGGMV